MRWLLTKIKNLFMIKKMKKLFSVISASLPFIAFPVSAFADQKVDTCSGGGAFGGVLCFRPEQLGQLVGKGMNFVFVIAAIAALAYLVYGGIKWITSEGDKSSVEAARNQIVAALIGLVVIAVSFLVINLILFFFGGNSLTNLQLPQL